MKLLKKCSNCGRYTMREQCPKCGSSTSSAHPAKYSPQDKYAQYRRKQKYG